MTDLAFTPETRMLVDGELIQADSGKTCDNINPADAEVIGVVADASEAETRRAFDHTDWSTDKELRKRRLQQLHDAIVAEKEELPHELIAGGYTTSDVGRQNGIEGFEQYLESKIVAWPAAQ